jgi:TolB-like protein
MVSSRALLAFIGLVCISVMPPAFSTAGIEYVTVKAEGEGSSVSHATASALSSAVAQVNGAALASTQLSSELTLSLETQDESAYALSTSMAEVISQQTKGLIRDYSVTEKTQESGVWTVHVEARVAKYTRSAQADRLRMSVIPFRLSGKGQEEARDRFVSELGNHLAQSRKFAMLDRQYEDERKLEMDINASADAPMEEMVKLGNRLGTDYMIVGKVEDAATHSRSTVLAGRTLTTHTAKFAIAYRVIDAPTGQVKFADSWSRSAEGASVFTLANQAAEAISRQIVDAITPVAVESVSGDVLFLGQGGKSIKVGQKYRLLRNGDAITDSYTGESLGRQEIEVGLIEIIEVQSKVAKARVLSASIDVAQEFAPSTFVVRLQSEAPPRQSSASAPAPRQTQAKRVETLKTKSESDW